MTNRFADLEDLDSHIVRARRMVAAITPVTDEEHAKLQAIEADIALLEAERDRRAAQRPGS